MTEDPIHLLYESTPYPALSYPSCDPAVMAVAARMSGLECPSPSRSQVLEVGCSFGHHLLHLAARWPNAHFTGIDFSSSAIEHARTAASVSGIKNVDFYHVSLEDFDPEEDRYDFIIAHGFYSWVPPLVSDSLMTRLPSLLNKTGIAAIGYNTLPGWALRRPVGEILRQWMTLPEAEKVSPTRVLEQLEQACPPDTYGTHMKAMIHHMRTQGASTLPFDDLPECNHPCTFTDFFNHTQRSGLRYLGEADYAENQPANLTEEALAALSPFASDSLVYQQALDVLSGRSHRVSLVCADDVQLDPGLSSSTPLGLAIRTEHQFKYDGAGISLRHRSRPDAHLKNPLAAPLFRVLLETAPRSLEVSELLKRLGPRSDRQSLVSLIMETMRRGLTLGRIDSVDFSTTVPDRPCLSPLRLYAVRHGRSLVDVYHSPLVFSEAEYKLLAAMDGSRSIAELELLSARLRSGPEFHQWLASLAGHGVFE